MTVTVENDPVLQGFLAVARGLMAYHRYEVHGLEHVPQEGAAMIVVNHSLATYDSILLGAAIYLQTGRFASGLADRRIFQTPGIAQLFRKLRAVEGSPAAGEELLRLGELLVLAPGGMRESLRPSSRRYQIDWDGRLGFARLSIKAQVPILLAACPAADEIYRVYDNPITPFVYHRFKWPLFFARGLGPTALPRPVKLVHTIHSPMTPPPLRDGRADEDDVRDYHADLVVEMEELMRMGR